MYADVDNNSESRVKNEERFAEARIVTVSGLAPLYNHDTNEYVSVSTAPVCVNWQISTSANMSGAVNSGTAYTSSDIDYTIKVWTKNDFRSYGLTGLGRSY